ncbi:MAG: lactate utilization protein [Candidatus Moranbacteria bacterium]|nr:lactate utilization protein [Candidatus Moranbacteria bacterium]
MGREYSKKEYLKSESRKAIKKAVGFSAENRRKVFASKNINEDQYKKEMTAIRQKPFENFERNLKLAKQNFEKRGFQVYEVKEAKEARNILNKIIGKSKKIISSKTNTGREIEIKKVSEKFDWNETDLGDFIVKMFKETGEHFVLPAIHITAEMINKKIKQIYKDEIGTDPEKLTHYLCRKIREKILEAEIGITGANFFTQEGQIVLLENEGNISLVSRLPKKHIVICGIDKITESVDDAVKLCQTAALFGTGQDITQYVSVISGPSKTADIENQLVQGAQGAHEVHVILVDNGRRKMIKKGFGDILRCINCGSCINFCPVYNQKGSRYGNEGYIGSKGIVFSAVQENLKAAYKNGSHDCTICDSCYRNCPMKIGLPWMVREIRMEQGRSGIQSFANKEMMGKIKKDGNPFGKKNDDKLPDKLYCC